jgi:autotransporter-associated beta strand protein
MTPALLCRRNRAAFLQIAFALAACMFGGVASAQIVSATTSGTGNLNWATAGWSPSVPGSTTAGGDVAVFSGTANIAVTLSSTITLGRLDDSQTTGNFTLTGGQIVFKSGSSAPATMLMTRNTVNARSLQRQISSGMQLDSELVATFPKQQQRNVGFTNVISGVGGLSIYVHSTPSSGTDSNVEVLTSGTTAATNGRITFRIGVTGTANTHSGGTSLYGQVGTFSGNYNNIDFRTYSQNALGSGALSLTNAALNLDVYDQTVAGLTGGSGNSKISTLSGTAGTTTLTLDFDASAGDKTFAGQLMSGSSTGYYTASDLYGNLASDTMVRLLGLTKRGTGTQILTGSNTYTGATRIDAGRLTVNSAGSINSTSGVTVNGAGAEFKYNSATALSLPLTLTQGALSGTGTIGTAVSVGSGAILSPGNSPGTQAFSAGLTWLPGGTYDWEINNATSTKGLDPGWDLIDVTGGTLNLASLSSGSQFTLDLITLNGLTSGSMANYTPGQPYTWQIVRTLAGGVVTPTGTAAAGADLTSLFSLVTTSWASGPVPSTVQVKVSADGAGLDLVVVPEPATLALAAAGGAVAVGAALRRYRRPRA